MKLGKATPFALGLLLGINALGFAHGGKEATRAEMPKTPPAVGSQFVGAPEKCAIENDGGLLLIRSDKQYQMNGGQYAIATLEDGSRVIYTQVMPQEVGADHSTDMHKQFFEILGGEIAAEIPAGQTFTIQRVATKEQWQKQQGRDEQSNDALETAGKVKNNQFFGVNTMGGDGRGHIGGHDGVPHTRNGVDMGDRQR